MTESIDFETTGMIESIKLIQNISKKVNEIERFPKKVKVIEDSPKKVIISIELIDWFY